MELIYNIATFLTGLLILIGPILFVLFIARPDLFHKLSKRQWTRKSIIKRGIIAGVAALFLLTMVGVIFEPASVKAERLAKQRAETAQKAAAEEKRLQELAPIKKTVQTKSTVSFKTLETEDNTLPKDQKKTSVEGIDGERIKTYEVTYVKGIETTRELLKDEVTKQAVDKVVLVGTYVAPAPSEVRSVYSPSNSSPAPVAAPDTNSAYYANCTAARAAGAAPLYVGQPGYRAGLDRDNDGIACE